MAFDILDLEIAIPTTMSNQLLLVSFFLLRPILCSFNAFCSFTSIPSIFVGQQFQSHLHDILFNSKLCIIKSKREQRKSDDFDC
jgi:hypothetical protein